MSILKNCFNLNISSDDQFDYMRLKTCDNILNKNLEFFSSRLKDYNVKIFKKIISSSVQYFEKRLVLVYFFYPDESIKSSEARDKYEYIVLQDFLSAVLNY